MENNRRFVDYQNSVYLIYKPRNIEWNGRDGGEWADHGQRKSGQAVYGLLISGLYSLKFSQEARDKFLEYVENHDKLRNKRDELVTFLGLN